MGGIALLWMTSCISQSEVVEPAEPAAMESWSADAEMDALREANLILVDYLELHDGDRYVLTISETEAEKLGVVKEFYEMALVDIANVNEEIQIAKQRAGQDPNFELIILDPDESERNQLGLGTQTRVSPLANPVDPYNPIRGSLRVDTSEREVTHRFNGPLWLTGVRFFCLLNSGIVGYIKCSTYAGGILKEKQVMGSSLLNRTIEVDVAATNTVITVMLQTGCPQGAVAAYEGMGNYNL